MGYDRVLAGTVRTGGAAGSVESSFDAILLKPTGGDATAHRPWRLTILLRMNLRQLNPNPWPIAPDADGKPFWIDRWTLPEWQQFKLGADRQASMWNGKFWLKPPAAFMEGDIVTPGRSAQVWRPYLDCQFGFRFYDFAPNVHRTIQVAKLNVAYAKNAATVPGWPNRTPDGETFRSNAVLWDSYDLTPSVAMRFDFQGWPTSVWETKHYAIAHEIGHALGLGHIGVMRPTPLCVMAQRLGWSPTSSSMQTRLFAGGAASSVCYGEWDGDASSGEDIMGMGSTFSTTDGLPWVWAIQQLRHQPWETWDVLLKDQHAETGSFVM